jgi:Holliday junction resolvase RusA-like endonuclease
MSINCHFVVYGIPVPQARAGRQHYLDAVGDPHSKAFDPSKSKDWKNTVGWQVRSEYHGKPHLGPVVMDCYFYLPRPKRLPKKYQFHTRKPDLDNLLKAVKDALKGIIYKDDSQVFDGRTRKLYGYPPRVVIALQLLSDDGQIPFGETWTK